MAPAAPDRRPDLVFHHVADELCVVVSVNGPVDEAAIGALYTQVQEELNKELCVVPEGGEPENALARDLRAVRAALGRAVADVHVLRPLARLSIAAGQAPFVPKPVVHLPRHDGRTTLLCYYALPPTAFPAQDLALHIRAMINHVNSFIRQRSFSGPGNSHWEILAATPNWLSGAAQGDHTGGGPGSAPVAISRPKVDDRTAGAAGPYWQFQFAEAAVQRLVDDQRVKASAKERSGVIVAVLDTSPTRAGGQAAAGDAGRGNWLLQEVAANVAIEDERSLNHAYFAHLGYYLPNWLGGLKVWMEAHTDPFHDSASLAALQAKHYAMADHGLFVTGIIRDIAPAADIRLIRVLNDVGVGDLAGLTNVLRSLPDLLLTGEDANKRLVINLSLMVNVPPTADLLKFWFPHTAQDLPTLQDHWGDISETLKAVHAGLAETIAWLAERDILVVAAAGNDALEAPSRPEPRLPARYETAFSSVLAVAAVGRGTTPASFSNRGNLSWSGNGVATFGGNARKVADAPPQIEPDPTGTSGDLDAPIGIFSAAHLPLQGGPNETGWVYWAGTSFSTPIVSGLAAAYWSQDLTLSPAQVIAGLRRYASALEGPLECSAIVASQP
jgi:subtilisin family serine protease